MRDLNLLKNPFPAPTEPPPVPASLCICFVFPLPVLRTPHQTSKSARVKNSSTHWIPPSYLSRDIYATAAIPRPDPTSNFALLFDPQDSLSKLMHSLPQLAVRFCRPQNGFYSFRAQTDLNLPFHPDSHTVVATGVADLYSE